MVRVILKICDELDKAKDLHEYFKKRLETHIKETVLRELQDKEEEVLLQVYIKEWKDYTILVHFIRKMFYYLVIDLSLIGRTAIISRTTTKPPWP